MNRSYILSSVSISVLLAFGCSVGRGSDPDEPSLRPAPVIVEAQPLASVLGRSGVALTPELRDSIEKGDVPIHLLHDYIADGHKAVALPHGGVFASRAVFDAVKQAGAATRSFDEMNAALQAKGIYIYNNKAIMQQAQNCTCNIACTLTATATESAKRDGQQLGNQRVSTPDGNLAGAWNRSTIAQDKRVANWDDRGTTPAHHGWDYHYWPRMWCYFAGVDDSHDLYTTDSRNDTRRFDDSEEQQVQVTMTCQPKAAADVTACGANWSASIGGLSATDKTEGALRATNYGTGDTQLSVYASAIPYVYMSLDRPPLACPNGNGWPSSKGTSQTDIIDMQISSATTTESTSDSTNTINVALNTGANGVTQEVTLDGKANATLQNITRYLSKEGTTVNGGSRTINVTHHANVPGSYRFLSGCTTESVTYKAGIDSYVSWVNKNSDTDTSWWPNCATSTEKGSIHNSLTVRALLSLALTTSCSAQGTTCSSAVALAAPQ